MRLAYLAQDRPDCAEVSKHLAQRMSAPTVHDWEQVRRLGRYLRGRPMAALRFREQALSPFVDVFTDADWAGCALSRKSTSGVAARHGKHTLKTASNLQSIVTLSVAEAEYYALVKGAALALSLQSLYRDWGLEVSLRIHSDSSSARSMCSRQGVGKVKHMATRWLWIQERLRAHDFTLHAVPTEDNPSDIFTKSLSRATMEKHCTALGLVWL